MSEPYSKILGPEGNEEVKRLTRVFWVNVGEHLGFSPEGVRPRLMVIKNLLCVTAALLFTTANLINFVREMLSDLPLANLAIDKIIHEYFTNQIKEVKNAPS